jgi:MshEN domain
MAPRKDLGSLLVDENVIGPKDLERVERERGAGRPLWLALIDAQLTTEDELFFVLAQRFGVAILAEDVIAAAVAPEPLKRHLSREQALAAGLLPIEIAPDGRRVTVVMVDPSDEQALAAFLTRAQIPEGRAVLGLRSAIERAIERNYARPGGTVEIDPALAAEIKRLPERSRLDEALTPLPRGARRGRKTSPGAGAGAAPLPGAADADAARAHPQSVEDALRAEERFSQALIQAIDALAGELEARAGDGTRARTGGAAEMARLSRRVARQLGLARRAAEEIGVAAYLFALDRLLRQAEGGAAGEHVRFGELGWPAAGEGGLLPTLRALTAASAGFGRGTQSAPPLGARIIGLVADYLELGAASGEVDLGTVSQLLRASSAGAPVVDALLRVLESDRGDTTPATKITTLPATSVLKDDERDTPEPVAETEKTVKKMAPAAPSSASRARRGETPEE